MNVKNRSRIIALLLCTFIFLNMALPTKRQEVKAVIPVAVGAYVVGAVLISAGVYAESDNLQKFSSDIYNSLTTEDKVYLDSKGNLISYSTLNGIKIMPDVYNRIIDKVKAYFGATPPSTYNGSYFGNDITISNTNYVSATSPINILSLPVQQTFFSGASDMNYSMGVFNVVAHTNSSAGSYNSGTVNITITCPDGYKVMVQSRTVYSGSGHTPTGAKMYKPVIYGYGGANPDLHFLFWDNVDGATYSKGAPWTSSDPWSLVYNPSTQAWTRLSNYNAGNLYNFLMAHTTGATIPTANIDTTVYSDKTTTLAVNDMSLQVAQNFDTLAGLSSEQIGATEIVGNNILTVGANILKGLTSLGNNIIEGLQTLGDTIVGAITTVLEGIKSIVQGIGDTLTDIKDWLISLPQSIVNAITEALGVVFGISDTFFPDWFNDIKIRIKAKFPHNLDLLHQLETTGNEFTDIKVSLMGTSEAVIVDSSSINDNINWVRNATSCFWIVLLVLYLWRRLNYVIGNSEFANGTPSGIGSIGATGGFGSVTMSSGQIGGNSYKRLGGG